jgi:hypothetical protein
MRCISALRVRTSNALHGGLTPPALGRTCRRRCRWAILADESDTFPTGGLRPPLLALVQRPSTGRTTIFAMHERTFTRAAGISPPWFGETNAARRKSRTVMRPRDGRARAAGVSPRWFPNAPAVADVFFRIITRASHGWSTPAALGLACGSCCRWRFVSGVALVFARLVYVSRCWKFMWRL